MPRFLVLSFALLVPLGAAADGADITALDAQARSLVAEYVGRLKPQLQGAMAAGGPTLAVEVCAAVAPGISDELSQSSGWQVRRVSLRARNASRAMPDAWERSVLAGFDQQREQGADATTLQHAAIVDGNYRYMQAQIAEPLCLGCHGTDLTDEVLKVLDEYYPDDKAVGYQGGQVRGAISLLKPQVVDP